MTIENFIQFKNDIEELERMIQDSIDNEKFLITIERNLRKILLNSDSAKKYLMDMNCYNEEVKKKNKAIIDKCIEIYRKDEGYHI